MKYEPKAPPAAASKRVFKKVQGRPPADPDAKAKAVVGNFFKKKGL